MKWVKSINISTSSCDIHKNIRKVTHEIAKSWVTFFMFYCYIARRLYSSTFLSSTIKESVPVRAIKTMVRPVLRVISSPLSS